MDRSQALAVLSATAEKPFPVTVKGWEGFYAMAVTGAEFEFMADEVQGGKKAALVRAAAQILCDADGNRIFDINNDEDLAALGKQSSKRLLDLVNSLSEDAKAAEGN